MSDNNYKQRGSKPLKVLDSTDIYETTVHKGLYGKVRKNLLEVEK